MCRRSSFAPIVTLVGVLSVLASIHPRVAAAAPEPDQENEPAPPPPSRRVTPEARQLFQEGIRHYERGEYQEAIRLFDASYAISQAPGLLFNLGQAYRLAGDCLHAVENYREYLRRAPGAVNHDKVEQRIRHLGDCGRAIEPTLHPTPSLPAASPEAGTRSSPDGAVSTSADTPDHAGTFSQRHRRGIQLAMLGTSLTLGLTGAWFLARGTSKTDRTSALFQSGGTWDRSAAETKHDGEVATWVGLGLLGGATLAALGSVWSLAKPDSDSTARKPRRFLGITLSGCALVMGATSTFFLTRSYSTESWISNTFQRGGIWNEDSARREREARSGIWVGYLLAGSATAAALAASWLLLAPAGEASAPSTIAVGASKQGVELQWHAVF